MNNERFQLMVTHLQPVLHRAKLPAAFAVVLLCGYHLVLAVWFGFASSLFQAEAIKPAHEGIGERWAWFSSPQTTPIAVTPENVRESRLNAKLLGILQRSNGSIAIIDTGNKKASKVFKEGDKLNRTVSVHKIEATRVLIIERGVISSLTMETKRSANISSQNSKPKTTALNNLLPRNLKSSLLAGVTFSKTSGGTTGMNLGTINPQLLRGTELKSGDVVLSAGGTPIEQILNSPNSYQNLLQLDNIDITVMRNGNEENVSINPRSVAPNLMRLIATQNR